jgi:hypothetical protein
MYCVFLLFTPIVLDQMMKGRAWLVGTISTLLWALAQCGIGDSSYLVPWIDLGTFNILAWQAYFVAGQYLGYRKLSIGDGAVPKSRVLLAVCIAFSLLFFVDRHLHFLFGVMPLLKFSFGPGRNPARFLDAACLGYLVWWLPRAIDQKLMRLRLFNFFNLLGRHSLQVFAFSLLVSGMWSAVGSRCAGLPGWIRVVAAVISVLGLAIPARLHEMHRKPRFEKTVARGVEYPAILQTST